MIQFSTQYILGNNVDTEDLKQDKGKLYNNKHTL